MNQKNAGIAAVIIISALGLSGCFAPILLAGAAGAGAANIAGSSVPLKTQVNDASIKTQVIANLNKMDTDLAYKSNVEVTVFNGIVLLLGQVPSKAISHTIAKQTSEIQGVKLVYNQLTIGPSVTFSTFSNDTWITTKVKSNMVGTVDPLHFKVVTQQGVVYLLGLVTKQEAEAAANVARQTDGVKHVIEVFSYINSPSSVPPSYSTPKKRPYSDSQTYGSEPSTTSPPIQGNNSGVGSDASD